MKTTFEFAPFFYQHVPSHFPNWMIEVVNNLLSEKTRNSSNPIKISEYELVNNAMRYCRVELNCPITKEEFYRKKYHRIETFKSQHWIVRYYKHRLRRGPYFEFWRTPATISQKLTFSKIRIKSYFIAFPDDGDDSGHGGFRGKHNVFIKTSATTASNIKTGIESTFPQHCLMQVILLNL